MARAILEILGDASSAKRAGKETGAVLEQLAVNARKSSAAVVAASIHKTDRLRSEIAAYQEIAVAAKLGSQEQITAAELAARAQSRLGKVAGVRNPVTPLSSARQQVRATQEQIDALHAESSAYRQVAAAAKTGSREQIIASELAAKAQARAVALTPQRKFGTSAARAQVLASVKETEALRVEAAAYGRVAAAARLGSQEQIIAADRAAKAQERLRVLAPQQPLSPGGAARVRVLESVKQTEALRAEALAYREVAAAAAVGSREQVAASQLAARAESRLATSLGISSHEARSFARSADGLERDLGRASRGALAGSGIFRGLGRSIAFASGGFLAFASAGQFIRTSIDAAKDALVTQRQLGRQIQNDGKSFKDYRGQIDQTNLRLSAMSGFTKDELDQSLTTILRTTSNVSKALRDNALAANIARARHIGLAQAALVVAKTEAGNTTLLRRQGFQIAKNATVEQALALVRAKVAGQALAGTTTQERFGAVLHDTEVIIGAGLLPTLNKYLASSATWLSQMNESGRLQKDVAATTRAVGDAFGAAKTLAEPLIEAFKILERVTGGTKHALELLGTAFVVLEARSKLIRWGLISSEIGGVGTSAVIASGEVATLRTRLLGLSKLGPIAIAIGLSFIPPNKKGQAALDKAGLGFLGKLPIIGGAEQQVARAGQATHDFVFGAPKPVLPKPLKKLNPATRGFVQSTPHNPSGELRFGDPTTAARTILNQTFEQAKVLNPTITRKTFELGQKVAQAYIDGLKKKPKGEVTLPSPKAPGRLSLGGRFNIAELKLAKAQLTATNADDIAILKTEAGIVRQQIASAKTLKDKTALTQKLVGIVGQLKGLSKAASDAFTLPQKFDLAAARASVTASAADDLAAARNRQAAIQAAVNSGKLKGQKLTDALNQLSTANDQIKSAQEQATQAVLDRLQSRVDFAAQTEGAKDDIKALSALRAELLKQVRVQKTNLDLQKQLRDVSSELTNARQFKALGLGATGDTLVPGRKALQKDLGKISDAVSGTFLDTSKTQSLLSRIRRVLGGGLGALSQDVRSKIKEMLDGVDQQLKDHSGSGPETKFQKANTKKLLAGLGLSPAEVRAVRARVSQLGAGGTVPRGSAGAQMSTGGTSTFVVESKLILDGRQVATSTTRHQQKQARRNPGQRRGPHAGE